nr:MAG TPA: hypothetical protein [Caudoviricetes sp.]
MLIFVFLVNSISLTSFSIIYITYHKNVFFLFFLVSFYLPIYISYNITYFF